MRLRAHGLSTQTSWLPSLCICVHAAQSVLATYFQLYQPVLLTLAQQSSSQNTRTDKLSIPVAFKLAVTWRQVRRVMLSAFVIIFAYWHGEILHSEASRYMAMARLLLEYPRWRWGSDKLSDAMQTLVDVASLADFPLLEHMQSLLPGVDEHFLRPLCDPGETTIESGLARDPTGLHFETFFSPESWPTMYDSVSSDSLSGSNISTIEDQTLFGLWGNIEFPLDSGPWTDNTF